MIKKFVQSGPLKPYADKLAGSVDIHLREIIQRGSLALLMKVFSAVLAYGFNVFIARLLGAQSAGFFILGTTALMIASTFGRAGLDNSLVRFTASLSFRKNWSDLKNLYQKSVLLTLTMSVVIAVLLYVSADFIAVHLFGKPQTALVIKIFAPALVPFSLAHMHSNLLKGLKKIRGFVFISDQILPLTAFVLMTIMFPVAGFNGVVWGYAAATLVMLYAAVYLWRRTAALGHVRSGGFAWPKIFQSCLPLYIADIAQVGVMWSPHIILGVFAPSQDVAVFTAARGTAKLMSLVLFAVNMTAAPKIAMLFEAEGPAAVKKLILQSARLVAVICLPMFVLLAVLPKTIMSVFGPEYINGAGILVILAVGYYINVAFGPVMIGLTMTGHERLTAKIVTGCGVAAVLLQILFVSRYGLIGAAVANTIILTLRNVLAAWFVYRKPGTR